MGDFYKVFDAPVPQEQHAEAAWFAVRFSVCGIGGDPEEHRPRVAVYAQGTAPAWPSSTYLNVFLRGPVLATSLFLMLPLLAALIRS